MLDLTQWDYSAPYTLYRGEDQEEEYHGRLYWNFEREEKRTWEYPGSPAAVVDTLFVVRGKELPLTPTEDRAATEWAMERMAAMAEAED